MRFTVRDCITAGMAVAGRMGFGACGADSTP
jgi:hypothetical protein